MKQNKTLKVLSAAALAATLVVPVAAPAFAATYSDAGIVTTQAGITTNLGSVKVEVDAARFASLATDDYLIVKLPSDFEFQASDLKSMLSFPHIENAFNNSGSTVTGVGNSNIDVLKIADNQVKFTFKPGIIANSSESKGYFYINFNDVKVDSGFSGEVKATFEGKENGVFSNSAEKVIATVGSGAVTTSIDGVKTITSTISDIDAIRIKEDRPGAFENTKTVKLKLPNGFEWDKSGVTATPNVTGDLTYTVDYDGSDRQTLVIKSSKNSATASDILIKGLKVVVEDDTVAKTGDVIATISGSTSNKTSSLVVAKYGDYSAKVYAVGDPKNVTAGQTGEKLGNFAIEETVKGSLVPNRTITLTLDGKAKWALDRADLDDIAIDNSQSKNVSGSLLNLGLDTNPGISLVGGLNGNRQTLKITLGGTASTSAIKAVIKDAKIDVSAEAEGDIKVIVGGTAGLTGEMVLGKVVKPVTATVDGELPKVVIGTQDQAIGDIYVTENAPEALDNKANQNTLALEFPQGVVPTVPTKVEVVDGDLALVNSSTKRYYDNTRGRWVVSVDVKSKSAKAGKIKFSGIKVTTDRTVPEGSLSVGVRGSAVIKTDQELTQTVGGTTYTVTPFAGDESVTKVDVAKVVTPAAGKGSASTAIFKLNSKSFTVDGKTVEMDVQPLVKWDRAYVPVRFAANALGVADENILWDDKTQTVTIMKDGKIVQMTVGKKEYTVNGVKVAMDAPVLRNKAETNNRTMLPLRYIANALNVPVDWNKETSEITLGEVK